MRETDYVERAFWAGWLEAIDVQMSDGQLSVMCDSMKGQVAQMARDYVESILVEAE